MDTVYVKTAERHNHERPDLVREVALSGPAVDRARFDFLTAHDLQTSTEHGPSDRDGATEVRERIESLAQEAEAKGSVGDFTPGVSLHQLQTLTAPSSEIGAVAEAVIEDLQIIRMADTDAVLFPNASVHLIHRDRALILRTQLPAVLLRVEHDRKLKDADLKHIQEASNRGELIFAASTGLSDGIALLEAYLAPLFGCLTPFVWCFPVTRLSGTLVFSFGRAMPGAPGEASELLQTLPSRTAQEAAQTPTLPARGASAAIRWWARRLDKFLGIISDPAIFVSANGEYAPSKQLHALLSVDQLFRRVASIQRAHRDGDARRVLLFTVLDTFEKLTSRSLTEMCDLSFAERTLKELRESMSDDVAAVLLPCAVRGVEALRALQDGFYLSRQMGSDVVVFTDIEGVERTLSLTAATAEYIRVLRNATHGHGSNRKEHVPRTDALLSYHDGILPHDLALLAYLYLLETLSKPDLLSRTLYSAARAH